MRTRVLSLHADYGCRRSGACCTTGWPIPVEPRVETGMRDALRRGALRLRVAGQEPFAPKNAEARVLALDAQGRCVLFEAGAPHACALHRQMGHEWLPLSCRQFPRVALLTPHGVSLTLSHFCPTAAAMLFREDRGLEIVEDPPAFPPDGEYEGLDARDALPLLRPGVILDWDAHRVWEEHAVATLAREGRTPEAALARLAGDAETARAWTPGRGPLAEWIAEVAARPDGALHAPPLAFGRALREWRRAASCVPADAAPAPLPDATLAGPDAHWVAPAWADHSRTIRRYLAAKAFASWCAVQGEGLRTAVAFLQAALGVLRVEAGRACAASGRLLDAAALERALRGADLLLVHLTAPEPLARRLGPAG